MEHLERMTIQGGCRDEVVARDTVVTFLQTSRVAAQRGDVGVPWRG
jgi:hypothetical protein